MKKNCFLIIVFFMITVPLHAQDLGAFEKKIFLYKHDTMPYRILLPVNYNPAKKYPLILFLHGAGERGNDNEKQLIHSAAFFLSKTVRNTFPAFVIIPQCKLESYWSNMSLQPGVVRVFDYKAPPTEAMAMLLQFIPYVLKTYRVKTNQVYAGGLSMGGMGVFEVAARKPGFFSAAFAICGGGDTTSAKQLSRTAWWIFHGEKDDVVWPYYSKQMASALSRAGAKVKLTIYPEANHNSWDKAFAEPQLLPWLFTQHK